MAPPPPPALEINPPLLNTANPWATDLQDLTALYKCPHTGAVTTRTSLIKGFGHDPALHQHVFFEAGTHRSGGKDGLWAANAYNASLNNLGYSPFTLDQYLAFIKQIVSSLSDEEKAQKKWFIVSVTGGPEDVVACYELIAAAQRDVAVPLAMEINLSCPNIHNTPPPAYDGVVLLQYLKMLSDGIAAAGADLPRIPFGVKTPPYTHSTQYEMFIDALRAYSGPALLGGACPLSFVTATNTLGSCLVLSSPSSPGSPPAPSLPGTGMGGMAGAPLHPLALGNVATIRRMLDAHADQLGHIRIIGAGGVQDAAGFARMRAVGASAVGVGTGLGLKGVAVFAEIAEGGDA